MKFVTEVIPKKNQILLTSPHTSLGQEIIHQLQNYSHLEVIALVDPNQLPETENLSVVLFLIVDNSSTLSRTLSNTVHLYQILQKTKSSKARFYLIIPDSKHYLSQASITLLSQFSKIYGLNYQVLDISLTTSTELLAQEIIKKFIKAHTSTPKQTNLPFYRKKKFHLKFPFAKYFSS